MNPRNLTREAIEELNDVEPYCFETDREEQWFNVGLQYGLDVADSDPISPWISIEDDLPCNHDSLLIKCLPYSSEITKPVLALVDDGSYQVCEMFKNEEGIWQWSYNGTVICWFPIPKPPKE